MTAPETPNSITLNRRGLRSFLRSESMVAPDPVTDRALIAVMIILTFMAALTTGLVQFATAATARWQVVLASEVTVQIRPQVGRDIEADLKHAEDLLRNVHGVTKTKIYPREETARLLEPWLGSASGLDNLPVPRLIAVQIQADDPPDILSLGQSMAREIPRLSIDDHRTWTRRLSRLGDTLVVTSLGVFILVMMAVIMAIVFATRGAMAGNRAIIEVLHFIGAEDRYIARVFQFHFFTLGLIGGAIGGGLALIVLFGLKGLAGSSNGFRETFGLGGITDLSGAGWNVVGAIFLVVAVVSGLAALVSRLTVFKTISKFE